MKQKDKVKLVTQLVSTFLTDPVKMQHIRNGYDSESQYKPDHELAVHYANLVVEQIIHVTSDPVYFPENVV